MIELVVDKAPDATASRLGYHVSLGFGQAMNTVNSWKITTPSGASSFDQYLKEGYASYLFKLGKGLQVDAGNLLPRQAPRSLRARTTGTTLAACSLHGPFPTTLRLRAKYTFNDKFALTGYVMNGWNAVIDNNSGKTIE